YNNKNNYRTLRFETSPCSSFPSPLSTVLTPSVSSVSTRSTRLSSSLKTWTSSARPLTTHPLLASSSLARSSPCVVIPAMSSQSRAFWVPTAAMSPPSPCRTWSPILSIASVITLMAPAISCSPVTSGAFCEGPGICTSTCDFFLGLASDPDPTPGSLRSQRTLALWQAEHALAQSGRMQDTP